MSVNSDSGLGGGGGHYWSLSTLPQLAMLVAGGMQNALQSELSTTRMADSCSKILSFFCVDPILSHSPLRKKYSIKKIIL